MHLITAKRDTRPVIVKWCRLWLLIQLGCMTSMIVQFPKFHHAVLCEVLLLDTGDSWLQILQNHMFGSRFMSTSFMRVLGIYVDEVGGTDQYTAAT